MDQKTIIILFVVIVLWYRSYNEKTELLENISDLEHQNYELTKEVEDLQSLKGIIDDCNISIANAKQYEASSYEEMEDALNGLSECY
jgi:cell division protein FtsL